MPPNGLRRLLRGMGRDGSQHITAGRCGLCTHRTAVIASPQAREHLMGRDGLPDRPRTQRPTAGVAAARPPGEPRRWGRRLPACGHWSRHHGRGATPPGRRGPRRAGYAAGPPPFPACGTGYATGADEAHGAHDGYGAANSPPEAACGRHVVGGWATERLDAGGALRRALQLGAGPKGGRLPRLR